MNGNKQIIRDLIRKESLRVIKESQASFLSEASTAVKHSMEDVNDVIGLFEKKLEGFNNDEKSAMDKEDYLELKTAKENQMGALTKIINGYSTKLELLKGQQIDLQKEILNTQTNGAGVFKGQDMNEFSNEKFEKSWGFKIETPNSSTSLVKIMDNNAYKVMKTDIAGINPGDLWKIPDLSIGGEGVIEVYRKIGDKHENVKNFKLNNITKLIKNPQ